MPGPRLETPPSPPEWRRSVPFFALAVVLHGLVLLYPRSLAVIIPAVPLPIQAHLTSSAPPAEGVKAEPPMVQPPPRPKKQAGKTPALVTPQPLETLQVPASSAPPATVPAAAPTTASTPRPPDVAGPAPSLTAVRFNADYLRNPQPDYPAISRRLGEEGKVLIKVRVATDGTPLTVNLEKSSNFARLDQAALRAVAQWRFIPARLGETPVEASVIVPIVFRLES